MIVKVGVVGCGRWGRNHVRVFDTLEGAELVAVCDSDSGRLGEFCVTLPSVVKTADVDAMLGAVDVDAVVVATPASTHYEIARRCLEKGKHVLVEKPLATSYADAVELVKLARERGVVLMTGSILLYNAGYRKLEDLVRRGFLGRVYYAFAERTGLGPVRNDVDAVWDRAAHDVAVFNRLFGTPWEASAVGVGALENGLVDAAFMTMKHAGGVTCHTHVSWMNQRKASTVSVVGSEARVTFDDANPLERLSIRYGGVAPEPEFAVRDEGVAIPRLDAGEPLREEAAHFLACVESGAEPVSGGRAGADVVAVLEAASESVKRGGAPVEVEL